MCLKVSLLFSNESLSLPFFFLSFLITLKNALFAQQIHSILSLEYLSVPTRTFQW